MIFFFFFFPNLMERRDQAGSAYEWQAGTKSGSCNSDKMLKKENKGRVKMNGVIKI